MLEVAKQETRGSHAIEPKKMHTSPPGGQCREKERLTHALHKWEYPSLMCGLLQVFASQSVRVS
uniref:Uncharacterized protein n=1 Tax=Anguilla anguilla TaxID=7936 RepID=A0A0E9WM58_ANGAN